MNETNDPTSMDQLSERLHQEAAARRPAFDEPLHARVMREVVAANQRPARSGLFTARRALWPVAALVAVACGAAVLFMTPRTADESPRPVVDATLLAADLPRVVDLLGRTVEDEPLVAHTRLAVQEWSRLEQDAAQAWELIDQYALQVALATE